MTVLLASRRFRLAHRVSARHASTGAPITGIRATMAVLPAGWSIRTRGGDVLVTVRDGAPVPVVVPALHLAVQDPHWAGLLAQPAVDVALTTPALTLDFAAVPMRLTIDLLRPNDGAARTGATLVARATSGPNPRPTIALPEIAPGTYRSAEVLWTAALTPMDLLVNTRLLGRALIDFTRSETRIRLVDTT